MNLYRCFKILNKAKYIYIYMLWKNTKYMCKYIQMSDSIFSSSLFLKLKLNVSWFIFVITFDVCFFVYYFSFKFSWWVTITGKLPALGIQYYISINLPLFCTFPWKQQCIKLLSSLINMLAWVSLWD